MRSVTAVVALSALSMVAAQNSTAFTIDINSVPAATRNSWCIAQENTCGELCDGNPKTNNCELDTLDYSCTCQNGTEPGLQYYTQTIDTFVCQEAQSECITANVGNAQGQANCTATIGDTCGTLNPANYSASSSTPSSTASSASSPSGSATATGSAGAASSTVAAAGAAPVGLQSLGTGAAAAFFGLLAYML